MTIRLIYTSLAAMILLFVIVPTASAWQAALQRGYDAGVTGANLLETALNTSNVSPSTFGLAFKLPVDDNVFAQPLYVPNVAIPNQGTHNMLYVATMSDTVYGFDADSAAAPLWVAHLAARVGATPLPYAKFAFSGNRNVVGNLGILSTPVIDPSTGLLYVVTCTLEGGAMTYRLHALDITNGAEPIGPGVRIAGAYGSSTFDARYQTQRVSLTLAGSHVIFGFAALELEAPGAYTGWVFGYDKSTLRQDGVFATSIAGSRGGGVWQSGRPPAVDSAGHVYVFVGNGYTGGYDGVKNFSDSILKLDPANGLKLLDWFTPGNFAYLDANDLDLGSSGPMLVPGTALLTGGGKSGDLYVVNTANLGKFNSTDAQIVQKMHIGPSEFHGGPVYWPRSRANGGPLLYNWSVAGLVKAYGFNGSRFNTSPNSQAGEASRFPGGILTLSANGEQHGTGVLWATTAAGGDAENNPPVPGVLHAFDAENLGNELWNSTMKKSRDDFGLLAKFNPPLVVSGKVYMATFSNQIVVYSLLRSFSVTPSSTAFGSQLLGSSTAPAQILITNTGATALALTSITLTAANTLMFSQTNSCAPGLAAGASCTVNVIFTPTATGAAAATLSVNMGNGAGTKTVALSGTGVAPAISLSVRSLTFGNQLVNVAGPPAPVTVTNAGSSPVPLTGIVLSTGGNQPFSQTNNCGATLAAGANCTISVVFDPGAAGPVSGVLTINGGGGAGPQAVSLSGYGIVQGFSASPASVSFADQLTNTASAPVPITVTNTGNTALPIASITLTQDATQSFSQTNNCGTSIGIGGTCVIKVVFAPTSAGPLSAAIAISADNGIGTQTVQLAGNATTQSFTLSSTAVTFGNQAINTSSGPTAIIVTNTGSVALPVNDISWSASGTKPFTQTNTCGNFVDVGANCSITIVFAPSSPGPNEATLTVSAGRTASAIDLSGVGVFSANLTASAATVTADSPLTLTWSSAPGASCSAVGGVAGDGWDGTFSDSGSKTLTESATGTVSYGLNCGVSGVDASANTTVTVTLPTVKLAVSPDTIAIGKPVTLTWTSSNAAACNATDGQSGDGWAGDKPTNGSATITPKTAGSITYTLTCTAASKSARATTQVSATSPAAGGGGGGGLDIVSLLALLTAVGSRSASLRGKPSRCWMPDAVDRTTNKAGH